MSATRIVDPHVEAMPFLASIPLIESYGAPRGSILHVAANAFMDAPSVPALVMHPVDYQVLQVAVERGTSMRNSKTQLEGIRRHVQTLIDKRAARAARRIDRMYRTTGEEQR